MKIYLGETEITADQRKFIENSLSDWFFVVCENGTAILNQRTFTKKESALIIKEFELVRTPASPNRNEVFYER